MSRPTSVKFFTSGEYQTGSASSKFEWSDWDSHRTYPVFAYLITEQLHRWRDFRNLNLKLQHSLRKYSREFHRVSTECHQASGSVGGSGAARNCWLSSETCLRMQKLFEQVFLKNRYKCWCISPIKTYPCRGITLFTNLRKNLSYADKLYKLNYYDKVPFHAFYVLFMKFQCCSQYSQKKI